MNKTYRRIKQNYYWPSLKNYIQNFIRNCRSCQTRKLVRQKTKQPMTLKETPEGAVDKVSMDIAGPMPSSELGNNYILTMQDLQFLTNGRRRNKCYARCAKLTEFFYFLQIDRFFFLKNFINYQYSACGHMQRLQLGCSSHKNYKKSVKKCKKKSV